MKKILALTLVVALAGTAWADLVVYSQPVDLVNKGEQASGSTPGERPWVRAADNFTLDQSYQITDAHWWGGSENFQYPDLTNISDFTVTIYEDSSGLPGSVVHSEVFATAATNPVDTGELTSMGSILFYHSVDFTSPVSLSGGTQYWFSVSADLIDYNLDDWRWSNSGPGGVALDWDINGQWEDWSFASEDVAFELTIPEPASLVLLAVATLFVRRR